ncbi:accessory factor associated with RNA polymerase II [Xylographa carneopallida]|nr:accessory factor associated with RNA polymerase II [Xylographa carneopallida]
MAEGSTAQVDPLLILRSSIASSNPPVPTTSADASAATATDNLALATHLHFSSPSHQTYELSAPTRFVSSSTPVDLRSIYFAWQKKDVAIPDYIASAQQLTEELAAPGGAGGKVQNLVFVERLDLITWLEGASDESEYITPLEGEAGRAAAAGAAMVASGAVGGAAAVASAGGRAGKTIDPRLQEIYNGERKMGDRNTMLRGIKPTDFSHVRKSAEAFLGRTRARPSAPTAPASSSTALRPAPPPSSIPPSIASHPKKPSRRPDPIILLSPSASSLLRMSNIKPFLESGTYIPPAPTSTTTILHVSRLLPGIDAARPLRFILVDSPDQFKPDYWDRVVAVFTTGQTWQFRSYRWSSPAELFARVLGVYLGWRGEEVPEAVRGWGRGVVNVGVDKWVEGRKGEGRWRDREVVESVWGQIEAWMKGRGWGANAG